MALGSRHFLILNAIAATLNADPDISARDFKVRKKAYNRGPSWTPGAFVAPNPLPYDSPYHETTEDELIFRANVVVVDPRDSDLVAGLESHLGAIERVQEIFRAKAHSFMPATVRALDAAFDAATTAGKFPSTRVQMTNSSPDRVLADSAFEAGFDASACIVTVRVLVSRYDARLL